MSKTMKRVSALLLAILMIVSYMPMMQETAYAAKKKAKKPAAVKGLKATVKGKKITLTWKKAKNAKKYQVSIKDNSTKLTATKTTKKKKLTITGQWSTKYTIQVKGVNGKKKGKAAKKTVTIGIDPKLKQALEDAAANKDAADKLQKQLDDAQKAIDSLQKIAKGDQEAIAKSQEAIDAAQKALDELKNAKAAWDELTPAQKEQIQAIDPDLYDALEGISAADLKAAQDAIDEAQEAIDNAVKQQLELDSWNPEVKNAINDMIIANTGKKNKYAVFDFDNTCSIYDVEEQLAVYQLSSFSISKIFSKI